MTANKDKPLTGKQEAFCQAMFTIGSETFGNGVASARVAGYKGDENVLAMTASRLIRKDNILIRKAYISATTAVKLEHNRDIAISILTEALVIARAKKDNTGIVQACRELDAISNLHSSTIHSDIEQPQAIEAESIDEYRAMAKAALERAKIKLA